MKKIFTIFLSVVMMFSFSISVFAESPTVEEMESVSNYQSLVTDSPVIQLKVGESVTIPFETVQQNGSIQPFEIFPGDGGTLTLTATSTSVNWSIALAIPATSFSGLLRITDISSGFNISNGAVSGFSGSVPYTASKGHMYSSSLNGAAFFLGITVAKTAYNYIIWQINP